MTTPEVEPQVSPNLNAAHLKVWSRHDCRTQTVHGSVPDWVIQTWSPHDIIVRYGL